MDESGNSLVFCVPYNNIENIKKIFQSFENI